jgi:predicted phosphate transport protein (TIGR00153 family)
VPTTPFLNMFARSPIRPLEEHMAKVDACVKELGPFFASVLKEDWSKANTLQQTIAHLENDADDMKRELRLHLPKSLFMPVSRSDVLELLHVQDRLANKAKDIAGIVLGRKMIFPESIAAFFMTFLERSIQASEQANKAIHELDELLETGFSGNEIKLVEEMIAILSRIEHDTDDQQIQLRRKMFDLENSLPPIEVMFLYKVIEWTGDLADRAREIGDRLQILLAR